MSNFDGGPAFPRPYSIAEAPYSGTTDGYSASFIPEQDGMTLRDYFAAAAVGAALASATRLAELGGTAHDSAKIAAMAYDIADAMIQRRIRQ